MSSFLAFRSAAVFILKPRGSQWPCPSLSNITSHFPCRGSKYGAKFLKNSKIPYEIVSLVDDKTGRLGPPQPLNDIIKSIDPKTHYLRLVSDNPQPVVRIMSKKELEQIKREQKARARATAERNTEKEIQLTWSTAAGDLEHKFAKVREELEKGYKISMVFLPKKGANRLNHSEMRERLDEVAKHFVGLGIEFKSRRIERGIGILYLQGKLVENSATPDDVEEV